MLPTEILLPIGKFKQIGT